MVNEEYGVRELYRNWRNLSSNQKKELSGQAVQFIGRSLYETVKEIAFIGIGICTLGLASSGLVYLSNIGELPATAWSSRVYENENGSTVLERRYNMGGIIRCVDKKSDGLDLEDRVYQYVPRVGQIERRATETDIRIFNENKLNREDKKICHQADLAKMQ